MIEGEIMKEITNDLILAEQKSSRILETRFLKKSRRQIYIALETIDFVWDTREIDRFIRLWENDIPIDSIAKDFNRPVIECIILLMDLEMKNKIKPREHGLLGYEMENNKYKDKHENKRQNKCKYKYKFIG